MKLFLTKEDKVNRSKVYGERLMTGHVPFFAFFDIVMGKNVFRFLILIVLPLMILSSFAIFSVVSIRYKNLDENIYRCNTIKSNYPNLSFDDMEKIGFSISSGVRPLHWSHS